MESEVSLKMSLGFVTQMRSATRRFLVLALFLSFPTVWSAETGSVIRFRTASYVIGRSASSDAERTNVEWKYAVMIGSKPGQFEHVNAWLREKSVEVFAQCLSLRTEDLLKLPDRKLVAFLAGSSDFAACDVDQLLIEPAAAFGQYMAFRRMSESQGLARPQHSIEVLLFDLQSSSETDIASLFKPGALKALNAALAEVIGRIKPNCQGRSFVWWQVSLEPPNRLFIEFPYNPAEWDACGDGIEMLQGRAVSSQLRNPASLRTTRSFLEVR